jgi:hypothetical protein
MHSLMSEVENSREPMSEVENSRESMSAHDRTS